MATKYALLFIFVIIAGSESGKHDIYAGNKIYSIFLRDHTDLLLLGELQVDRDLDILRVSVASGNGTLVRTTPSNEEVVVEELKKNGLEYKVHLDNLPLALETFDSEMLKFRRKRTNRQPFEDYPRYDEIDSYMESLAANYPDLVTVVTAGNSFEGRPIKYLKISKTNFEDTTKPIIAMEALLHAREWVTTAAALYAAHRLVEDLRAEDQDLLEDMDWIIYPLVNADGYEYTHTTERMWRKTRSVWPEVSETCVGVDANRNFDAFFGTEGVSSNPCSDVYPGHQAFSEPETGYTRDILLDHLPRIQMFIDLHSYGNYILYPYGHSSDMHPPNHVASYHLGALMGAYMDLSKIEDSDWYKVGHAGTLFYLTSGSADDYAQIVGIPFSFCFELPGYTWSEGFLASPERIPHFTEETWRGIAAGARVAKQHYKGPY